MGGVGKIQLNLLLASHGLSRYYALIAYWMQGISSGLQPVSLLGSWLGVSSIGSRGSRSSFLLLDVLFSFFPALKPLWLVKVERAGSGRNHHHIPPDIPYGWSDFLGDDDVNLREFHAVSLARSKSKVQ